MKVDCCGPCLAADDPKLSPGVGRFAGRGTRPAVWVCKDHKTLRMSEAALQAVADKAVRGLALLTGRAPPPPPAVADPADAGVGFGGFALAKLKQSQGDETRCFSAEIRLAGAAGSTAVAFVRNEGSGGCNRYDWNNKGAEASFLALAKARHPGDHHEVDDLLVEDMIEASERAKWVLKCAARGLGIVYEFVPTAWDYGSGFGLTASQAQMKAYDTQAKADVELSAGKFVWANRVYRDGTLGPKVVGKVPPRTTEDEPALTNSPKIEA